MKKKYYLLLSTLFIGALASCQNGITSSSSINQATNSATEVPSENEETPSSITSPTQTPTLSEEVKGYYKNVDTSSSQKLLSSLSELISTSTKSLGYDGVWGAYSKTDVIPNTNYIWDIYSDELYECDGIKRGANYSREGDSYNREHSIPQSWFNSKEPMKSDLFHVYPTDGYVNNQRSNYVYGEVKTATYTSKNGSKLGDSSSSLYTNTVFEPIDDYKGDLARSILYMAVRYKDDLSTWTSDSKVIFKDSFPYLTDYAIETYTKWAHIDPVSDKEIARNEAIYKLQNNRNPFIDHPEFIDSLWPNSYEEPKAPDMNKVNNVINLISKIPATVTLANESQINNCNTEYIQLSIAERGKVTNYVKLVEATKALNELIKDANDDTGLKDCKYKLAIPTNDFAYSKNPTLKIDNYSFKVNVAGCFSGEYRLGANDKNKVAASSKFNLKDQYSGELEMNFDLQNVTCFAVEYTNVSDFDNYYIYYSADGGTTWTLEKTDKRSADKQGVYMLKLDTPKSGRFALVVASSGAPRTAIKTIYIDTAN